MHYNPLLWPNCTLLRILREIFGVYFEAKDEALFLKYYIARPPYACGVTVSLSCGTLMLCQEATEGVRYNLSERKLKTVILRKIVIF